MDPILLTGFVWQLKGGLKVRMREGLVNDSDIRDDANERAPADPDREFKTGPDPAQGESSEHIDVRLAITGRFSIRFVD